MKHLKLIPLLFLFNYACAGATGPFELLLIPIAGVGIIFLNSLLIALFSKSESVIIKFFNILAIHVVGIVGLICSDFLIGLILVSVISILEIFFIIIWIIVISFKSHKYIKPTSKKIESLVIGFTERPIQIKYKVKNETY